MSDYRDVVVSGGTVFNAVDGDGCFDFIVGGTLNLSGGIASGATMLPNGVENVFSGGLSVGAVLSGITIKEFPSSRGELRVYSGGEARETVVLSGGLLTGSGGMVNMVSIESGGGVSMVGGTINSATVGGWLNVMALASDTKIVSGGTARIVGTNWNTEILSGGSARISLSYSYNPDFFTKTYNLVVHSGGKLNLGYAMLIGSGTNIASGCLDLPDWLYDNNNFPHVRGGQVVNGVADGLIIINSGFALGAETEAHNTMLTEDGELFLYSGAIAYESTVDESASMFVYSGATAVRTVIRNRSYRYYGGRLTVSGGVVSDCNVGSNGVLLVNAGVCDVAVIESGGVIWKDESDSKVTNLTLKAGSILSADEHQLHTYMVSSDVFIEEVIRYNTFGGLVSGFVVADDNESFYLVPGASGIDLSLFEGELIVSSGAMVKNTNVGSRWGFDKCKLQIESGAYSEGTVMSGMFNFCEEDVYGIAVGTRINSVYSSQCVLSGGISSAAIVESAGLIRVSSGGMLIDAVCKQGVINMDSGAIISGTTRLYGRENWNSMSVNAAVQNCGELVFVLDVHKNYFLYDTELFVNDLDLIEGGTFRIDPGVTPDSHIYILADKADRVPELKITLGGVDRVFAPGETIKFGDKTLVMTNDAENGLRLEVSLRTEKLYGLLNSAGDYVLNEQNAVIRSLVMVGAGGTAGNTNGILRIAADTNANVFGGTSNADIGGNVDLLLGDRNNSVYRGLIFGGSRAYGVGASATIGQDIAMSVDGGVQQDNQKLIAAGKGTSAWIVGGGQAVAGGSLTVKGRSWVSIRGKSNVERVVGGAQASGVGSVAECEESQISIGNSVVRGDVYGGGYADNGGVSIVSGLTEVHITGQPQFETTVMGNIYGGGANPRHDTNGGSSIVKGDSLVCFSGKGEAITVGMVSGDGRVAGTVLGTRRLEFYCFTGEFSGMLKNFDVVKFSGSTKSMTCANYYEISCFEFDLNLWKADGELFLAGGMGFAEGDKQMRINIYASSGAGTYDLMVVDDATDLSTLMIEVYKGDQLLASFDYGGSSQGFSVEKNDGILSLTIAKA